MAATQGHNTQLSEGDRQKLLPSIDEMKSIFDYEPATGVLRWRRREGDHPGVAIFNGSHAGKPAGSPHAGGYRQVSFMFEGVKHKALVHRICFAIHYGYMPETVDHRNNRRADNRACNLRDAGSNGNQCNRSGTRARSGLKGVYTHTCSGRFFSQIKSGETYRFLGTFDDEVEAARAYDAAAIELHGEFARTNASLNLIGA